MDSNKINSGMCVSPRMAAVPKKLRNAGTSTVKTEPQKPDSVAFKGAGGKVIKRLDYTCSKIADFMSKPGEIASATITFIGTAFIAPFAIMVSPTRGGKDLTPEQKKEKKKFQALRQPVSALLAFGFQMPTSFGLGLLFNKLAYDKAKFIDKDNPKEGKIGIGELVPSKEHLARKVKRAYKKELKEAYADMSKAIYNGKFTFNQLKNELKEKIRTDYNDVGLEVSEEELNRKAGKRRKLRNFAAEKIAGEQRKELLSKKVKELMENYDFKFNDADLVTEEYIKRAEENYKTELQSLKKKHKINLWDEFVDAIGAQTKKYKEYKAEYKSLAKEKGLEILKRDMATEDPDFFKNESKKIAKYIENKSAAAQKAFDGKVRWITLGINIGMVAISCVVLNWLHPKFANLVENISNKRKERKAAEAQKVEVRA